MEEFGDSLNPSVLLLSDWWETWFFCHLQYQSTLIDNISIRFGSSHNTPLSLEMVIACLDELGRGDIVEVIREEEEEKESPQVNDEDGEVDGEGWRMMFI